MMVLWLVVSLPEPAPPGPDWRSWCKEQKCFSNCIIATKYGGEKLKSKKSSFIAAEQHYTKMTAKIKPVIETNLLDRKMEMPYKINVSNVFEDIFYILR